MSINNPPRNNKGQFVSYKDTANKKPYLINNLGKDNKVPGELVKTALKKSIDRPNRFIVLTKIGQFMPLSTWKGVETVYPRTIAELNYCLVAKNGQIKIVIKNN